MAEGLVPCAACRRHIRCGDVSCPFCGTVVPAGAQAPGPSGSSAASNEVFARMAAAAAVAASVAQVTSCTVGPSTGAFYGGAEIFEGDGGFAEDATVGFDDGATVAFYGGPGIGPDNFRCRTAADCQPGEVCCGSLMLSASCKSGPCPTTSFGPLQLCGISDECLTAGDVCG